MMSQKEIRDQIETLIQTNQTSEPANLSVPVMQVKDLTPIFQSHFTQEGAALILNKTHNLIHTYNRLLPFGSEYNQHVASLLKKLQLESAQDFDCTYVRDFAVVEYFGFKVQKDKIAQAGLKLVKMINDMAANKWGLATLSPLSLIELNDGTFCIVSYIAIDTQHKPLVQSLYGQCSFGEGNVPSEFI